MAPKKRADADKAMISVVLYGRNDSYGYNLHKRAVLSLNCIAEVLDDPDDEIIFVDYNTPDDLPTFVEAIADTLTERARALTRVIRVRERLHARFAPRTHLRALESPSRNAAVRRSNPRNRWILSTNTDMVFIPKTGSSLSSVAASLPDGFYHTARFELPEILWERLDRMDPQTCIATIERWGPRLQLQEVVYGTPITLFDGPGDFQLILRDDLFRIGGFDERMLLGWHVDSNIARRLELLRGEPVKSALENTLAFHCDHNRETTPAHSHGATQNDWGKFVANLGTATVVEQADSWGFAGEALEDVRLNDAPQFERILEDLVPPMRQPFYVTGIGLEVYNDLRYDPEHVMPYVANVIGALPRSWNVLYAGVRRTMYRRFVDLWKALGFTGEVLVPEQVARMVLDARDGDGVRIVPEKEAHERADLLLFEAGAAEDDERTEPSGMRPSPEHGTKPLSQADYFRICLVHGAFARAVAAERKAARPPRRFIVINMQNNPLSSSVDSRIGASWTPAGTRVRHGFVLPNPFAVSGDEPIAWMELQLPRWRWQRPAVKELLRRIRSSDVSEFSGYRGEIGEIVGMLRAPDAASRLGIEPQRLQTLVEALERRRPSQYLRLDGGAIVERLPRRTGLSRLMAVEDFDDPDWGDVALRVVGTSPILSLSARRRNPWDATHLVFALERTNALGGAVMLLQHPRDEQALVQALSSALIDWSAGPTICNATQAFPGEPIFDAVVISPAAAMMAGTRDLSPVLTAADAALKPGGICILILDVVFKAASQAQIDLQHLRSGAVDTLLERATSWRALGPMELAVSAATVDCLRLDEGESSSMPCHLVYRKTAVNAPQAWQRYRTSLAGDRAGVAT